MKMLLHRSFETFVTLSVFAVTFWVVPSSCNFSKMKNSIKILNPPSKPIFRYFLQVQYSCIHPSVASLEVLASSENKIGLRTFVKHWSCITDTPQIKRIHLDLPDSIVFREDWLIRKSLIILNVMLRVWLTKGTSPGPYQNGSAKMAVELQPLPPLSRPFKQHNLCPRWDVYLLWQFKKDTIPQCSVEEETSHFLSTVYASTGEKFGIVRTFHPFTHESLEEMRERSTAYPWCTFSTWVFLIKPCKERLCAILHHIDWKMNYASPVLFLNNRGLLHIQVHGQAGESTAVLSEFHLPLLQWCHLNMEVQGRQVNLTMKCNLEHTVIHRMVHVFHHMIFMDDTHGYFVLGGGKFVQGIEGFYGPTVYFRNRISHVAQNSTLPQTIQDLNFTAWFSSCHGFRNQLSTVMERIAKKLKNKAQADSCSDVYSSWLSRRVSPSLQPLCQPWEAPVHSRRGTAARIFQKLIARNGASPANFEIVGKILYSKYLKRVIKGDLTKANGLMPMLLQAGCLGDHNALYLSSVLYQTGLVVTKRPLKATLLSLLAAQMDSRLALLHQGHRHHQGVSGVPLDQALAYAYYSNVAAQTSLDRQNPSPSQVYVESIHLNDEEVLKQQTHEDDDLFLWLKYQAQRGVADAQQTLGRMLFWGQQGISTNLQAAAKYYESGATKLENPVSMYDYGIILLKGQGVTQDIPKAVHFLNKAANLEFVPAINALGWYYERYEHNYEKAVQFWERADSMGCSEAPFNLGVMYSLGLYPGQPPDQFLAYIYYLKSARRGHIDGAIKVADLWMQGIQGLVPTAPQDAVLWTKWVSEQNGYLGALLRQSLDAYLRQEWSAALIFYLMAAETGYATAQFNMAFICEQNLGGLLNPDVNAECIWRYYNLSISNENPVPYALIKMGDLLYAGHGAFKKDLRAAAEMYKEAALRNDPQGWYSLGLLIQEGVSLSETVLTELGLAEHLRDDRHTLLTELYQRCRDHESEESYLPCSLALLQYQVKLLWSQHSTALKFSSVIGIAVVSSLTFLTILVRVRGASSTNV
ncbi:protein sel-1 homolog 3 [Polypterus senegalus]|uniref:protein sel-1 homolog 3 n=1 Tax=Polypterus senegalus TaxID=55291 RepID=UPI001964C97B|nr:protein sel-1 homolog 3 [Polypterus senegalus]XP_039601620.1 protein sel-1 homolog 3 [Polypterus senegalus]XP_039601621.1 protein sel-1 homolog 3 [Polypterus senegalus]